ncbi:MAG: UDP-N-acetylenolpyruvoylglucosamine reductase, partial [Oscillospiraceae bacterium]
PSAGSIFKRPEGFFAGALIEECGLKGASVGGAMVSKKHAGFIINNGNATTTDVLKLIELIQNKILSEKNIHLETEVKYLD